MIPLIYVLKNDDLCDAGEQALATLDGLRDEYQPFVFAPDGKVIAEARKMGFFAQTFEGNRNLTFKLWLLLAAYREVAFVATEPSHSLSMNVLNTFYRRRMTHLQIVDDASEDAASRRKSGFGGENVIFVTRCEATRARLIAQGARQERVRVIDGFLSPEKIGRMPRRGAFKRDGVRKILLFGADEAARAELIVGALKQNSALARFEIMVFGVAEDSPAREVLETSGISFGFATAGERLASHLRRADLLLQVSAADGSGTALLEAFAAGVPILAGIDGVGASFISHNINGFCFRRGDASDLSTQLTRLAAVSADQLNAVVKGGRYLLQIRFSAEKGVERFRRLVTEQMTPVVELTGGKVIF